jgi:hypothetical protein
MAIEREREKGRERERESNFDYGSVLSILLF